MKRSKKNALYLDKVMTRTQASFFRNLSWTRKRGWYLAGGTALALQIGHRTSVDLDFYTQRHFNSGTFSPLFSTHFGDNWKLDVLRDEKDNFDLTARPDVHLSCFFYPYHLLSDQKYIDGIAVASLKDIAAMKLVAISQRGRQRDFFDLYYLLQQFSLKDMVRFGLEKYPLNDQFLFLRGLLYFNEAEQDDQKDRVKLFDKTVTWKKVKKTITETVRRYQLNISHAPHSKHRPTHF